MDAALDAYLKRTLKKAVAGQLPPPDGRGRLLRGAIQANMQPVVPVPLPGLFFASPFFTVDGATKILQSSLVTHTIEMRLLISRLAV